METPALIATLAGALAAALLTAPVRRAMARRAPHAGLGAVSLAGSAVALFITLAAQAWGAPDTKTGQFQTGMTLGVAIGLAAACAVLLLYDRRAARAG